MVEAELTDAETFAERVPCETVWETAFAHHGYHRQGHG